MSGNMRPVSNVMARYSFRGRKRCFCCVTRLPIDLLVMVLPHPADLKKISELDPSNRQAVDTIRRLTPLAEEKREKLKEEMLGEWFLAATAVR